MNTLRQRLPFQRSTTAERLTPPTAKQNRADVQETPFREELATGLGASACQDPSSKLATINVPVSV
jgi:hypothetical protein